MTRQTFLSAFHLLTQFVTCLILYRNGVTRIENAGKAEK